MYQCVYVVHVSNFNHMHRTHFCNNRYGDLQNIFRCRPCLQLYKHAHFLPLPLPLVFCFFDGGSTTSALTAARNSSHFSLLITTFSPFLRSRVFRMIGKLKVYDSLDNLQVTSRISNSAFARAAFVTSGTAQKAMMNGC